jgi:hypothetical protein
MQELRAANTELKAQLARLQRDAGISQTAARDEVTEARQQLGDERAAADAARRQAAEAARERQEADEAHHARIRDLQKRCRPPHYPCCLAAWSACADGKQMQCKRQIHARPCTQGTDLAKTGCCSHTPVGFTCTSHGADIVLATSCKDAEKNQGVAVVP